MDKKKALFETINPIKAILILAVPTIISQLIDVFYNLADTFFLGRTGNSLMIASTGIAVGLFAIGIVISNLFGIGGGSLIARLLGINKSERLKNVSSFSFYLSIVVALIYSLIVFIFMKPILMTMGASETTYEYCRQYTSIVVVFGVPLVCASNTLAHLLRNVGKSLHAGIGISLGGLINIALDPLFMFVIFPSGSEVKAAAVATLISNIISLLYLLTVFLVIRKETFLSINPKQIFSIHKDEIKDVFKIGIPSALLVLLFIISQMITLAVMGKYGDSQVAAIGIVIKVEKIAAALAIGICQGMLPIAAYNYASSNHKRMNTIIKDGMIIGIILTAVCSLLLFLLPKQIITLFIVNSNEGAQKTVDYGTTFLRIRCLLPILMFINYHASYTLQSIKNGRDSFIHAATRIIVFYIPLIFICSSLWMENGLACSFEISEFLGGILGLVFVVVSLKKVNNIGKQIKE